MAHTRQDIKNQITTSFLAKERIRIAYGIDEGASFVDEFSLVSFENILFDILSFAIFLLEQLFNKHEENVAEMLHTQKSGRLPWYRTMALRFQYGFDLATDMDYYDNGAATPEEIANSKIIKYAAVNEGEDQGLIIIKIAGETDGVLAPISTAASESVSAYFEEIKYAGSRINVINYLPDRLFLNIKIYRDPLVLDATGMSILEGTKPVEDAINEFMKELPFNGELILAHLVDKLQKVKGVKIPHLLEASSSWIDVGSGGYGTPTVLSVKRIPESGYFEIPNFDNIVYVV